MKMIPKRGRHILAATVLSPALGVSLTPNVASAAFTDCPSGAFGSGGRACLGSSTSYTGSRDQYASAAGGSMGNQLNQTERSFGNRISNRCAKFYRWDYDVLLGGWRPQTLT